MKRKKSLTKALLLLSLVALYGCGGHSQKDSKKSDVTVNKTGFPIVEETLNMTMIAPGAGLAEWADMPTLTSYAEMTNIDWKFTTPPLTDFATKLNLAFASGDIQDVIFGASSSNLTRGMEVDYGSQGILLPLEDYIDEYAPNLAKILEENPDIRKSITSPDGHIYSLPSIDRSATAIWIRGPIWYNGQWLDALDVKEVPKTIDEFYELLVRMRDEDPNGNGKKDEIPLTDVKMESTRPWLLGAFGIKAFGIEEVDGKVRYAPITDNYRGYLEFMNKLYTESLLDKEVFSQSDEQKKGKGQNNQIGVFPDWYSFFTLGQNEDEALNNPMFQTLTSDYSKEPLVAGSPRMGTGTFAITSNCESPEAAMRWVDYLYSAEGRQFFNQGPEGEMWEYAENSKGEQVRVFTDKVDLDATEDFRGTITPDYGIQMPGYSVDLPALKKDVDDPDTTPFQEFIKSETEQKIAPFAEVAFPVTYLTKEEQDSVSAVATDLQTYIEQMEAKFITGVEKLDDAGWDKYVETIKSMGVEDYVKVYQQVYDRWAKS